MTNLRPVRAELRQLAADLRSSVQLTGQVIRALLWVILALVMLGVITLIPLNIVLWGLV